MHRQTNIHVLTSSHSPGRQKLNALTFAMTMVLTLDVTSLRLTEELQLIMFNQGFLYSGMQQDLHTE